MKLKLNTYLSRYLPSSQQPAQLTECGREKSRVYVFIPAGMIPGILPLSHLFRTPNYKKWPLVVVLIIFFCAPLQQPNHDNPPPTLRSVFPRLRSSNISDHTYIITQRPICMHRHLAGLSFSWLGTKTRLVHMICRCLYFSSLLHRP